MEGSLTQVTFRVAHDCPLAELSRAVTGPIQVWSGHRLELALVPGGRRPDAAAQAVRDHLHPEHLLPTPDGWMAVWRPQVDPKSSISRLLERHGLLWQQPLRVHDGWEHYDAISFGGREQGALDELRQSHPTQVARRTEMDVQDVTSSLFLSLRPALEAPTDKQAEAVVAAFAAGYYESPRRVTTADVAARLDITRSSFEERLRSGENRIMERLGPALRHFR